MPNPIDFTCIVSSVLCIIAALFYLAFAAMTMNTTNEFGVAVGFTNFTYGAVLLALGAGVAKLGNMD